MQTDRRRRHTDKVDRSPVTLSVIRGSEDITVARIGGSDSPIDEIAPGAGIFEKSVTIRYHDGPDSTLCPSTSEPVHRTPDPLLGTDVLVIMIMILILLTSG